LKNPATLSTPNSPSANRRFKLQKRSQPFIRVHNETLSVLAMCVNNPVVKAEDVSPAAVKLALLDSTFPISMK
jgi:hypothetical protein